MIWLHGEEELNDFLARLNSFHENIKFTWEIGLQEIAFLDVWITKVNGVFHTDVYSKSTDAHQYLNFKSCHPPHVKRAIPYSQGLRLKRVCNSENAFEKRLEELKGFLVKRCYCSDYVDNQFGRVREVNRNSLFKRKEGAEHSNRNCFVVDYHPALRALYNIFRELHVIVSWSERFLRIMPEPPMVCFRRAKNLKDHLVRSKLRGEEETVVGMFKCGKKKCKICDNVVTGDEFKSYVEGRSFRINHRFDCDTEGVVYLISCKSCGLQYVGNTITAFRLRFNNHKSSLNRYGRGQRNIAGQHIYAHFFGEGHLGLRDFMVQVIDCTNVNNPTERKFLD